MSLRHAILAMLDIEKGSGYDLVKRFDQSVSYFWAAPYQQIYRELQKLEASGFLNSVAVVQQGKPDKKVYDVTEGGVNELKAWLEKPAKAMKIKEPLLIKIYAGDLADKGALLEEIQQHKNDHAETLLQYKEVSQLLSSLEEPLRTKYFLPHQTLKLGIKIEESWLEWAEEILETLQDMA
ncbi:hypothetical protein A9Q99_06605 [Gammaproteobacteria bacterium 45_16_T64]|nr:hypothetical protein A9Q99_06605 [Gammaproteobacteria bacterium 45_16_T64]